MLRPPRRAGSGARHARPALARRNASPTGTSSTEADAAHRRAGAWIDSLTDEELHHLEHQSKANRAGRDLHTELTAYVAHAREASS
ncbi:hypothetical protein ACWGJT_32720 [Streptomyces xantholiticus]